MLMLWIIPVEQIKDDQSVSLPLAVCLGVEVVEFNLAHAAVDVAECLSLVPLTLFCYGVAG